MAGSRLRQSTLVVGLALVVLAPALQVTAQTTPSDSPKPKTEKPLRGEKMGARAVTGTVKEVTADGLVVTGRDRAGKNREWAFVLDASTKIEPADRTAPKSVIRSP